jgi:NADH-quinone oxidoreductase subunit N
VSTPYFDYHALAPEIILTAVALIALVVDLVWRESARYIVPQIAGVGLLVALIPVLTLAADGDTRSMFGGAFVVDNYSLAFTGFFLVVGYVTLLLSYDYVAEGDYYQGEFYVLILTSVLGMTVMASARDLISIFVALETITLPTFVLAGWRKYDTKSNEAAIKYFLIGVLSTAVMLYGMSFLFGMSNGSTLLTDIRDAAAKHPDPLFAVAVFLTIGGFAFKISAVPFHFWAPDTYEGAPTPVTAFLSVASKAGGFVALIAIIRFGFLPLADSWEPVLWILAAASIIFGNLAALRQTNIIRMLAYSSIAQGGFMLVPLAVAGDPGALREGIEGVIIYLFIYAAMNLGAFACVIVNARRTHSAEISSFAGLGKTNPTLAVIFSAFLFSLAGIPPLAGWFAKFVMFRAVFAAGTTSAVILGVIAAVFSVVAFFYYVAVTRQMWFREPVDLGEVASTARTPVALNVALALTTIVVVVVGVYPQLFARIGDLAFSST